MHLCARIAYIQEKGEQHFQRHAGIFMLYIAFHAFCETTKNEIYSLHTRVRQVGTPKMIELYHFEAVFVPNSEQRLWWQRKQPNQQQKYHKIIQYMHVAWVFAMCARANLYVHICVPSNDSIRAAIETVLHCTAKPI